MILRFSCYKAACLQPDKVWSFSADIDFTLRYYKPKILDAIVRIRDSKKRPDLDSIFHDISRNEASNINKDTVQILISKLIDSNVIIVKKTKPRQKSLFLTKDATAISTEDNTVCISLNDGCQGATPADPNYIELSVTKPKDSGNTRPNQCSNFISKAVGKIIVEAEAQNAFGSAMSRQFFADVIEQISVFVLSIPSSVFESYFGNVVLFD